MDSYNLGDCGWQIQSQHTWVIIKRSTHTQKPKMYSQQNKNALNISAYCVKMVHHKADRTAFTFHINGSKLMGKRKEKNVTE